MNIFIYISVLEPLHAALSVDLSLVFICEVFLALVLRDFEHLKIGDVWQ